MPCHCNQNIFFINKNKIPMDRKGDITYSRIICNYREQKKDMYCTRITMGSNLINYPGNCGTPTANLLTTELLFNSVILTPHLKFMCIVINDIYLCTPMVQYKYFRMKFELFPDVIIKEYDLCNKVDSNRNVHCEVR